MNIFFSVAGHSPLVDQTIGKQIGVGRLLGLYRNAGMLSDARLRDAARRLFHAVDGRAIVLRAEAEDDAPEPDPAALAAQFDAYRDVDPEGTDDTGINQAKPGDAPRFGYRLPDRLKIEHLTVSRDSVRETIEAGDALNGVALFKHWQRYHDTRGFPVRQAGVDVPAAVREDLLEDLTDEKLAAIERLATDQLLASWRELRAPDGFYVLPDDWAARRVDFEKLAADMQTEFAIPLPAYQAIGDRWLTVAEAAALPELANGVTDKFGSFQTGIAEMLTATREFGGDNVMFVQEGITGPPLRDRFDKSLVFFRITDTDPARPPAELSEVRERVVADLRRQADFQRLLGLADSIAATARTEGLLAAAVAYDAPLRPLNRLTLYNTAFLEFQLQRNQPLVPAPSDLPDGLGRHVPTLEAIIDHALALPADVDIADLSAADRIFVVPVGSEMAMMVVELTDQHPLDRATFERLTQQGRFQDMLVTRELAELDAPTRDVFDLKTLEERHRFKVLRREESTPEGDG